MTLPRTSLPTNTSTIPRSASPLGPALAAAVTSQVVDRFLSATWASSRLPIRMMIGSYSGTTLPAQPHGSTPEAGSSSQQQRSPSTTTPRLTFRRMNTSITLPSASVRERDSQAAAISQAQDRLVSVILDLNRSLIRTMTESLFGTIPQEPSPGWMRAAESPSLRLR